MNVSFSSQQLADLDADLLLVLVSEDEAAADVDALAGTLGETVRRATTEFSGKKDEVAVFYPEAAKARRAILLGTGPLADLDLEALRVAGAAGAKQAADHKATSVAVALPEKRADVRADDAAQALVEGFVLASYRYLRYKTNGDASAGPEALVVHAASEEEAVRRGAERGRVLAESVMTARDLVNLAPSDKTATSLAEAIQTSAERCGYAATVWDKAKIEKEKMGGLLAVNRGSQEPPTFTIMEWKPEGAANARPVVLVGKGIVFDTGGLSLKPTKDSMDKMKSDMAGAAAVVGAMEAVARLNLPLHVIGLIPATDNRPGENAYVPGDVIQMHSGTTVEVLNTDAEGRLVLADALSYAKSLDPELVIDLATLTGVVIVALGSDMSAVMTSENDGAAGRLEAMERAGLRSGDRVHRLPLLDVYGQLLESDVADLKNVGGREAGTITAGKFLEHFTEYPWLHLDIAGTAFLSQPKPYRPKGGTGFGVRLLAEFLLEYAKTRHPERKEA
ncbi:MAG: leucyl aminopeptidase [Rhodothermales bacterium]